MRIELLRVDINSLNVDAIVMPENSPSSMPVGTAEITTGGNLLCRFVIHAAPPRMGEGDEETKLRNTTIAALQRAEELALESVALPPMSTGVLGFTLEKSARVMLAATIDFQSRARSLRRVIYCLFGQEPHDVFQRVLQELQP
jgi:O-acetyl-ADP-ribose deacetylase (regulator of RNase III)